MFDLQSKYYIWNYHILNSILTNFDQNSRFCSIKTPPNTLQLYIQSPYNPQITHLPTLATHTNMSIHLTPTKKRQLADFLTSHSPKKPHLEPPPLDIIKISYFPSMRKLKIIDSEEADRIVHRVSGQQHRLGIIGSTGLCQDRSCTPVTHFVKNRKGEFEISVYHINIVPALIGRCLSAEVAALRLFCRNAITPNGPVRLEWVGPEPDLIRNSPPTFW